MAEKPTIFILWPRDHHKEVQQYNFGGAPDYFTGALPVGDYVKDLRRQGYNVEVLGNGVDVLKLSEIKERMASVNGDYLLLDAAHGNIKDGTHVTSGIYDDLTPHPEDSQWLGGIKKAWRDFNPAKNSEIATKDLLKLVPGNCKGVVSFSCYSDAATQDAAALLPTDTVFIPVAPKDQSAVNLDITRFMDRLGNYMESGKPIATADLQLFYLLDSIDPRENVAPQQQENRRNQPIPTGMAAAGEAFDFDKELKKMAAEGIAPEALKKYAEKLQPILEIQSLNLTVDNYLASSSPKTPEALESFMKENGISPQQTAERLRGVNEQIKAGVKFSDDDPNYPLALALAQLELRDEEKIPDGMCVANCNGPDHPPQQEKPARRPSSSPDR